MRPTMRLRADRRDLRACTKRTHRLRDGGVESGFEAFEEGRIVGLALFLSGGFGIGFLHGFVVGECLVVGALGGGEIAEEEAHALHFFGVNEERGDAIGGTGSGRCDRFDAVREEGRLGLVEAFEPPPVVGHALGLKLLGFGGGAEVAEESGFGALVFGGILAGEEHGFGSEAVGGRVLRRAGFAGGLTGPVDRVALLRLALSRFLEAMRNLLGFWIRARGSAAWRLWHMDSNEMMQVDGSIGENCCEPPMPFAFYSPQRGMKQRESKCADFHCDSTARLLI